MLPQWQSFTKSLPLKALTALVLSMLTAAPALALIKMDNNTIEKALIYGMQNQNLSLSAILGPNWVNGDRGSLLNIYSPFMVLATKAARGGFPDKPTRSDLNKAKEKFGKHVAFYRDPKNRLQVKFAVSFYGPDASFAKSYSARIVGFGRGKEFNIKPSKQILDQIADPVPNGPPDASFEAINAYYFNMRDVEDLQEFRLILESPRGEPLVWRLNNEKLY